MIIYYIQRVRNKEVSNIIKEATKKYIENINNRNKIIIDKNTVHDCYNNVILASIIGFFIGYTFSSSNIILN